MENVEVLSLKKICIEALVRDFDIILIALNKDENIALKNLLQRHLSDVFFEKLPGPLQKKHALFLINRYLGMLNLNRFSVDDIDDVIEILKRQGEGILAVQISEDEESDYLEYSEATLVQLAHSLPITLKSLSLVGTQCSGVVLEIMTKKCSNLKELNLHGCDEVTDAAVEAAFSNSDQPINRSLLKIDLHWTSVTTRGIVSVLNNCPNLTEIFHKNVEDALSCVYRHHVENNDSQFRKYNLEKLDLYPAELEAALFTCSNVRYLTVDCIRTQEQINICKDFERLEDVELHCFESVSLSQFFETRGSALHTVSITGNLIVPVQTLIQFCPGIQCLHLNGTKFGSEDGYSLDPARFCLRNLKKLEIGFINLAAEMRHINTIFAFAPNIETFYVYCISGFSDAFVNTTAVQGFPRLIELQIFFSEVVDMQSIRKLINLAPNMKRIEISRSKNISRTDCENMQLLKSGLRIDYEM